MTCTHKCDALQLLYNATIVACNIKIHISKANKYRIPKINSSKYTEFTELRFNIKEK